MILRSVFTRHGLRALQGPRQPYMRSLATESDIRSLQERVDAVGAQLSSAARQNQPHEAQSQLQDVENVPQQNSQTTNVIKDDIGEAWKHHLRQQELTKPIGTSISPYYRPNVLTNHPPAPSDITLELLLASQAHMGHKTSHWNPANAQYIFGIRQGIHIISLDATAAYLRRACRVVSAVAKSGGLVLYAGTRAGQERIVVQAAETAQGCHLFERWTPGSITNGNQILKPCKTKAVDEFDRTVPEFDPVLRTAPALIPDLVICANPLENWVMLHECALHGIPTIGIIDTDANPTWVTYPIPANDDSLRSVQVIIGALANAGREGQEARIEAARNGQLTYTPTSLSIENTDEDDDEIDATEAQYPDTMEVEEISTLGKPQNDTLLASNASNE